MIKMYRQFGDNYELNFNVTYEYNQFTHIGGFL